MNKNIRERKRSLWLRWILSISIGTAIGWVVYGVLVAWSYASVLEKVSASRAFIAFFQNDPTLPNLSSMCGGKEGPETSLTRAQLLRVLQNLGVVPRDAAVSDIAQVLLDAHGLEHGKAVSVCITGAELLTRVALAAGLNASTERNGMAGKSPDDMASAEHRALVPWLADAPGAYELVSNRNLPVPEGEPRLSFSLSYAAPLRTSGWGPKPQLDLVLSTLFAHSSADAQWATHDGKDSRKSEERDQLVTYARQVLLSIQRDPDVRNAGYYISVIQGPEQLAMCIAFAIALVLMAMQSRWRWIYDLPSPAGSKTSDAALAELDVQRLPIRWFLRTLPSIGFIGTVRGLSAALANADSIVAAGTKVEQAAAIGSVAATLGIAFTTTMVALVFGIVGSLVETLTGHREEVDVLARFQSLETPRSNVIETGIEPRPMPTYDPAVATPSGAEERAK